MKSSVVISVFLVVVLGSICRAQQQAVTCPVIIEYGNRNQVETKRSTLNALKGRVMAEVGNPAKEFGPVPACLGLFSEDDHRLVASTVADENGHYQFKTVPPGLYRLVVRDPQNVFCVANMPLRIVRFSRARTLVIHMRPTGIDDCSYGDFK